MDEIRELFWSSLDTDGVAAGIIWNTERDVL